MITLTAAQEWAPQPRVLVQADANPAIRDEITVYRVHPDGKRYRVLVGVSNRTMLGAWAGYDYHPPFNVPVTYTCSIDGVPDSSIQPSARVHMTSRVLWLIHPTDPSRSVSVTKWHTDPHAYSYESRATELGRVLGRRHSSWDSSQPMSGEQGTMVLKAESPRERTALQRLVEQGNPILVNSPWPEEIGWRWVQPMSREVASPGLYPGFPFRVVTIPYRERDQPDDALITDNTYADDLRRFPTYAASLAAHPTYKARILNIPRVP